MSEKKNLNGTLKNTNYVHDYYILKHKIRDKATSYDPEI